MIIDDRMKVLKEMRDRAGTEEEVEALNAAILALSHDKHWADRMKLREAVDYLHSYANNSSNGCGSYLHSAINTVLAEIRRTSGPDVTNLGRLQAANPIEAAVILSEVSEGMNGSIECWMDWLRESGC